MTYNKVPQSIQILLEDYCFDDTNNVTEANPKTLFKKIESLLIENSPYDIAKILNISVSFVIMIKELIELKG